MGIGELDDAVGGDVDTDRSSTGRTWPHELDQRLLGLTPTPDGDGFTFELVSELSRSDGVLFGGTALAATCAAFELASGRPTLWANVQFVASAAMGDEITCRVASVARGRAVEQLQVTGSVGDRLVFSALGAAAAPRPDGIGGGGRTMPVVAPLEDSERFGPSSRPSGTFEVGHHLISEFREAAIVSPSGPGHVAMWSRLTGQTVTTAAKLGFLADMVPIAVCRGAGVAGAGTSLDNSLRIGRLVDTEWILVELEASTAHGGYGYGVSHLWSPDGTLMATGSQTAKLFSFERFMARFEE